MINTRPQKYVFVLMPFSDEFKNVYDLCIKTVCKENFVTCERLDELIFSEGMLEKIYTQINKADFIIADMSERNANVFYEVGYAHALNKKVILLTNNAADIPFDLKHFQHIVYNPNDLLILQSELDKAVKHYKSMDNKERPDDIHVTWHDYDFSLQGSTLRENETIIVKTENSWNDNDLSFNIDVKNKTHRLITAVNNQICLLVDKQLISIKDNYYPFADNKYIEIDLGSIGNLYPQQSQALNINTISSPYLGKQDYAEKSFECKLRLMGEDDILEIPFNIKIEHKE